MQKGRRAQDAVCVQEAGVAAGHNLLVICRLIVFVHGGSVCLGQARDAGLVIESHPVILLVG